jgi:hypothetical protein
MHSRLRYRKGILGEIQMTLETEDGPIPIGSVPTWED